MSKSTREEMSSAEGGYCLFWIDIDGAHMHEHVCVIRPDLQHTWRARGEIALSPLHLLAQQCPSHRDTLSNDWTEVFSAFNDMWDAEGWIPVESELPVGQELVIIRCRGTRVRGLGHHLGFGEWTFAGGENQALVSHWMPLPP